MKISKKCPKCNSYKILRKRGSPIMNSWSRVSINIASLDIWVTKYICADCGFIEEWIDSEGDLHGLLKKVE